MQHALHEKRCPTFSEKKPLQQLKLYGFNAIFSISTERPKCFSSWYMFAYFTLLQVLQRSLFFFKRFVMMIQQLMYVQQHEAISWETVAELVILGKCSLGLLDTGKIPQLPGNCYDFPLMLAGKSYTYLWFLVLQLGWRGVSGTVKLPQLPGYGYILHLTVA